MSSFISKSARYGVLFAGLLTGFAIHANADVLANYTFTGSSRESFDTEVNTVASTLTLTNFNVTYPPASNVYAGISTATGITNDTGAAASAPVAYMRGNITGNDAATSDDFIQFTFKPEEGYMANLTSFSFDHGASDAGTGGFTSNWQVRYSLDGFATDGITLGTSTKSSSVNPVYSHFSPGITDPGLQSIGASSTVTFRIYLWDTSNSDSAVSRIDNIMLEGSVVAVPEPATYAAIFGLAAVGLAATRRRLGRDRARPR